MTTGRIVESAAGAARLDLAPRLGEVSGESEILASAGTLEARFATTKSEISRAQRLRYDVFFQQGGSPPDPGGRARPRDICRFDEVCDHLIVLDNSAVDIDGHPKIVGAYRLLRQDVAARHFGFYSAGEFDVGALIARHPGKRFLELGRSCVAEGYRGRRALELLWRGIWSYAIRHRVNVMFGCASFRGVDPLAHAATLRFLHGTDAVDPKWAVAPMARGYMMPPTAGDCRVNPRALPPLVKGYWRLGAKFSREVVVDFGFGTTDVLVVLPVEDIRQRYLAHFAPPGEARSIAA